MLASDGARDSLFIKIVTDFVTRLFFAAAREGFVQKMANREVPPVGRPKPFSRRLKKRAIGGFGGPPNRPFWINHQQFWTKSTKMDGKMTSIFPFGGYYWLLTPRRGG